MEKQEKIYGHTVGDFVLSLLKNKGAKLYKFTITARRFWKDSKDFDGNPITLARTDTEEKGRMYVDAAAKGIELT